MSQKRQGMVLVVAVVLAGAATLLATALAQAVATKIKTISRTQKLEQAFFIAEAGVQRARAQIYSDAGVNAARLGPDGEANTEDDGIFTFGESVDFAGGSFAVRALPGINLPSGITASNTNNMVVVISTGEYENTTRVIEAALLYEAPLPIPPPGDMDGALSYYGTNAYINLHGKPIKVDGRDYNVPIDFYATGASSEGVVDQFKEPAPASLYAAFDLRIDGASAAIYEGVPPNPPARTISGGGGNFDNAYWTNFLSNLKPLADNVITSSTILAGDLTLGTRNVPLITVVKSGASLRCSGNAQGAGILIIETGADFRMTGTFRYEGLVITEDTGFSALLGSGNPILLGATVVLGHNAQATLSGTPKIAFSSEALANLANLRQFRPRLSFVWWREIK